MHLTALDGLVHEVVGVVLADFAYGRVTDCCDKDDLGQRYLLFLVDRNALLDDVKACEDWHVVIKNN